MNAATRLTMTQLALLCFVGVAVGNEREKEDPSPDAVCAFAASPKSPEESWEARRLVISRASSNAVDAMRCAPGDRVAIYAAWEHVLRGQASRSDSKRDDSERADNDGVDWFSGFVEGRLRLRPPDWWSAHLRIARFDDDGKVSFPLRAEDVYAAGAPYRPLKIGTVALRNVDVVRRDDGRVEVRVGNDRCNVSAEVVEDARENGRRAFSVAFTEDVCYCAIHRTVTTRFQLTAIDRATSGVRWTADCWASGDLLGSEGPGYHYVQIVAGPEAVYVFGAGPDCIYIEAFATTGGAARLRFCTAY